MEIGVKIRDLREQKGLNQLQLSKMTEIPQPVIYNLEKGKRGISTETLIKLCKFFNVSADYVLGLKD